MSTPIVATLPAYTPKVQPIRLSRDEQELQLSTSVHELYAYADALAALVEHVQADRLPHVVRVMCRRRPYVFERNLQRWPDRLWHLVNRSYQPFEGIACDRAMLEAIGVVAWDASPHCTLAFTKNCLAIADDALIHRAVPEGLMALAGIVQAIAAHFDRASGGLPTTEP